jgi:hypothetical protein
MENTYNITLTRQELEAIRYCINMIVLMRDVRGADVEELTSLRDELIRRAQASRRSVGALS